MLKARSIAKTLVYSKVHGSIGSLFSVQWSARYGAPFDGPLNESEFFPDSMEADYSFKDFGPVLPYALE